MAKADDAHPSDWDEPPLASLVEDRPVATVRPPQSAIGRLMLWLVYFAILSWAGQLVFHDPSPGHYLVFFLVVGLGLGFFGVWIVLKLPKLSVLGWIFVVLGFGVMAASTSGVAAISTIPILVGVIIYLGLCKRAIDQDALLGIIALAANRRMPLAPGIQAFSAQVRGNFVTWTETLAELLRRGVPLPDALESYPSLIPRPATLLIRMGAESGNLARGLREAVELRAIRLPISRAIGTQLAYLTWIGFSGVGITAFLLYFIMPKFEAIFHDFGIDLPEITRLMILSSHIAVDFAWIPMLLILGFAVSLVSSLLQSGEPSLPWVDRLFARRHSILILRSLGLFVEAGQPITTAASSLARRYPTRWVRKKLEITSVRIDQGRDWVEAFRSTGLLTGADAGVLSSAQRAGNLAWAIHELTVTSERRWSFRIRALMQILFVGAVLIFGAVVFLMAVAYFAPLTTLILRLSQ